MSAERQQEVFKKLLLHHWDISGQRVRGSKVNKKNCAHIMHAVNNSTGLITHTEVVLRLCTMYFSVVKKRQPLVYKLWMMQFPSLMRASGVLGRVKHFVLVSCRRVICYLSHNIGHASALRAQLWHLQLHNDPRWFRAEVKIQPQAVCAFCI